MTKLKLNTGDRFIGCAAGLFTLAGAFNTVTLMMFMPPKMGSVPVLQQVASNPNLNFAVATAAGLAVGAGTYRFVSQSLAAFRACRQAPAPSAK